MVNCILEPDMGTCQTFQIGKNKIFIIETLEWKAFIILLFIHFPRSRPLLGNDEAVVQGLQRGFELALRNYRQHNGQLPARIVIYRDGVGDGMCSIKLGSSSSIWGDVQVVYCVCPVRLVP